MAGSGFICICGTLPQGQKECKVTPDGFLYPLKLQCLAVDEFRALPYLTSGDFREFLMDFANNETLMRFRRDSG